MIYFSEPDPAGSKEGKVTAVNSWLASQAITRLDYAYSDSINDRPLLSLAEHAFCINPDLALTQQAKAKQWQTYHWHSEEKQ